MEQFQRTIRKFPRYARFAVIVIAGVFVNMLLAVALLWLIYPEWSKKVKLGITLVVAVVLIFYFFTVMGYK